jgi:ABC-2 type transport system permease protein
MSPPVAIGVATASRRRASLFDAVAWEVSKLAAQLRTRITLTFCVVAPILVVLILKGQQPPPKDTLFGRYIHQSGLAMPLLILGFATQWLLPILTAIVAGDIFASEDRYGTWKTVLTRTASRTQLFLAKTLVALAFALFALALVAVSTILSSVVIVGTQPLVGLSGQLIPSGHALALVSLAWATALAPVLGFTCLAIFLSVWSRSPAFGIAAPVVLGLVMQLAGAVNGAEGIRPLLLTTPFESWHGLLAEPRFWAPFGSGLAVSAGWCLVCTAAAFLILRRRDVTDD